MPKKKKTRKQKVLADTRHREYFAEPLEQIRIDSSEPKKVYHPQPKPEAQAIVTAHYSYLYSDLLKTLILTISVIVAELALRYFAFGA
jgi:hypothetical protein